MSRTGIERTLVSAPAAYSPPAIFPDGRHIAVTIDAAVFPGGKELLVVKDPRLTERRRDVVTLMVNWRPGRVGAASEP